MRYIASKYDRLTHLILDDVEKTELTLKEIALKHQVSHAFVANRLKEYGIKHGRKSGAALKPSEIQQIIVLSKQGVHPKDLARKYDVTEASIYRHRKLAGFPAADERVYVHIKCKLSAATEARKVASFFGMKSSTFVSEAIAHYINHLKS